MGYDREHRLSGADPRWSVLAEGPESARNEWPPDCLEMTTSTTPTITRFRTDDSRGRSVLRRIVYGAASGSGRVGSEPEVDLLVAYGEREGYSADLLFGGYSGGELVTGALGVECPGRLALVFVPPGQGMVQYASLTVRVLGAMEEVTRSRDLTLLQALIDPADRQQAGVLAGAGYSLLAGLLYCRRSVRDAPPCHTGPSDLEFVIYPQVGEAVFSPALSATYEGSLDCPGLSDLRTIEDVLAGHRGAGDYDPTLWSLAKSGSEVVGVLLLSQVPGRSCLEVVYMGVLPQFRGRQVADALLAHARTVCQRRGIHELILAVDSDNTPARAVYDRWNFETVALRDAWILPVSGTDSHSPAAEPPLVP